MRMILSWKRHPYLRMVGSLLIAAALLAGIVSCVPTNTYALTMAVNPAGNGTASDETGTSPYAEGTVVDIKAVAAVNYEFVNWSAPAGTFGNATAPTTTFTMPAQNVTVTANFVAVYKLTIVANPMLPGVMAYDWTNASPYAAGTVVSIGAQDSCWSPEGLPPQGDMLFVHWTAPAGTFGNATAKLTTFTMPAQNVTVIAHFAFCL